MTAIELAVKARLLAHAGVVALVADRVEPQPLEQGSVLPAITYQVISLVILGRPLDGSNHGLARPRIQIDCWAGTYLAALQLEEQVFDALDGFSGIATDVRELLGVFRTNIRDEHEPDLNIHRRIADYFVSAAA